MKVVIAEKPSVGKDLAKVLGATTARDGYIEGNGIAFTWAYGHLVQLAGPEAYGFKEWSKENLPMLPSPFKLVSKQKREGKELKDDPGVKKQLKIIHDLFEKATEIIVATDAGREGELIFRYIYNYLGCRKPFRRLWISSQTDKAIKAGFADLKPGASYNSLYDAAKARSEADWLVGLNATQALSLGVGSRGVYSIGRVQTPTLAMICQRYLEHKNFKPEIYFQLSLVLEKNKSRFTATSKKFSKKEDAEAVLAKVKGYQQAEVKKLDTTERKEETPLLYDLTTLQQDANKRFGFSADKTLDLAQSLYERKFITYPRTGSRYIGDDVFETVPERIELLKKHDRFAAVAQSLLNLKLNERSVNADKVTDHHALLPTEVFPLQLSKDEQAIYDLVAGRMLEAFGETCIKLVTDIELYAGEAFFAKGVVIKHQGWRGVFNFQEEDEEDSSALPAITVGEQISIKDYRNDQKQTKPKPLYTEASLLQAMKTCGKEIEDEAIREAMKDTGIGTPATRAAIIVKLFSVDYIERQKKAVVPTEKGLAVYGLIKDKAIGNAELTGAWEKKLIDIEKGQVDAGVFMQAITTFAGNLTSVLLNNGQAVKESQESLELANSIPCPKCGKGKVNFVKNPKIDAALCSTGKDACSFILFREVAKKKLTDSQLSMLITKKKTGIIKGFTSKSGKPFEAALKLDETFRIKFDFPDKETAK